MLVRNYLIPPLICVTSRWSLHIAQVLRWFTFGIIATADDRLALLLLFVCPCHSIGPRPILSGVIITIMLILIAFLFLGVLHQELLSIYLLSVGTMLPDDRREVSVQVLVHIRVVGIYGLIFHRCFPWSGLDLVLPSFLILNTVLHIEVIFGELLDRRIGLVLTGAALGNCLASFLTLQVVEEVVPRILFAQADPETEETVVEQSLVHAALLDLPFDLLDLLFDRLQLLLAAHVSDLFLVSVVAGLDL